MISILGILLLLGVAWFLSKDKKAISYRTVLSAFALQLGIAAFTLYSESGQVIMAAISSSIYSVIEYSQAGINFMFGTLGGTEFAGFIFLFHVLPILIFMSALMSVLYYLGIMQWIALGIGTVLRKVTGASSMESLGAAANIFVSQTEAPVVLRPYVKGLKDHQFFTLMVVGMASVAGSVLMGYAAMGIELKYLVAASFMAAPGGILMAKMLYPADEAVEEHDTKAILDVKIEDEEGKTPTNVIEAAADGATLGLKLAANIGAMLIAFVALIALVNGLLSGIGGLFGYEQLSLELILGALFSPLMYVLGVPWEEAMIAGNLVGQKTILNEFVAFSSMLPVMDSLTPHTAAVVTFALCGFANLSSLAIQLGGLGALDPSRKPFIAKNGLRAMAAGTLANFMSAALASLMLSL
ncbi:NupC/NupG family nucleoside CNT transporter [Temperatibacter marinus]|uniref:Nucleoside permease n=1 Tax=Temperatibacter marinus TaxID=1456591 RepID=A0AA52EFR9_9PROT|nr:NupC/NupG family nucleoside CNT transporter [Temperatibacter marinus]WND01722.1 NupC/NupG family nucleoside CNT transporter [Temperatibacter marinus]